MSSLLQDQVRKFLLSELLPKVSELDEKEIFPEDVYRKFFQAGFGASFMPEEWGGNGDLGEYLEIATELGHVDLGFALSVLANSVLFCNNVLLIGTEEQKKKYLPDTVNGTKIGCWALTEPCGGSDAIGIQTTAEKVDGGYILNGSKTFITNAPVSDLFIVIARLKGSERKGIEGGCAFILERGMSGLSTGKPLKKMGHRTSPTGEIFLDNCFVPDFHLLGVEGKAFYEMKRSLDFERAMFSAIGMGVIDELLRRMVHYASERKQFGQTILEYQLIQEKIAQIGAEFEVLKAYAHQIILKMVTGEALKKDAAIMKLIMSKLSVRAADEAMQIFGGNGYMREYQIERFYRDVKLFEIGGGTSEIQKLIIAKEITKEYLKYSRS